MKTTLLIKYASRARPERLQTVVESVFNNADNPDNIIMVLSLDKDDTLTYTAKTLQFLKPFIEKGYIKCYLNDKTTKVNAFNRDIDKVEEWAYLLHLTDFTEICCKGFDTKIQSVFNTHQGLGLAIFPSANHDGKHFNNIHVIKRTTYDQYGFLYHPDLIANFEEQELESRMKKTTLSSVFNDRPLHRYVHPKWLYYHADALLTENVLHWKQDLQTIERLQQ